MKFLKSQTFPVWPMYFITLKRAVSASNSDDLLPGTRHNVPSCISSGLVSNCLCSCRALQALGQQCKRFLVQLFCFGNRCFLMALIP